ncbi:G-protein alpha subunit-domain-containing protein [Lactarius pseudohatsudake]|nr:G-protein alpha subunit-domain-containing protein [Lactarius pseudohatsudake]
MSMLNGLLCDFAGFLPTDGIDSKSFGLMSKLFEEANRIAASNYIPSTEDVLRARVKTTSITETRIPLGQLSIHIIDVGGQRSQRNKWIHSFESVTSIIFVTSLSEYDQVLLFEKSQNRMAESLVLFDSVINSRWFLHASIILFLNKIDVFRKKLPKVPLDKYFPEYTGGTDVNEGAKYILCQFMQANRARLSVYPHPLASSTSSPFASSVPFGSPFAPLPYGATDPRGWPAEILIAAPTPLSPFHSSSPTSTPLFLGSLWTRDL